MIYLIPSVFVITSEKVKQFVFLPVIPKQLQTTVIIAVYKTITQIKLVFTILSNAIIFFFIGEFLFTWQISQLFTVIVRAFCRKFRKILEISS